ncbi:MAG: hypothetical protein PWP24_909 [Clostridiales bacterium]|nr:hypothetical protein [Clostridiales bacterium]
MKKIVFYFTAIGAIIILISSAYYVSYKRVMEHYEQSQSEKENISYAQLATQEPAKEVDSHKEEQITSNTTYTLITYTLPLETTKREEKVLPPEWIGMNREALSAYLTSYMEDLPLHEIKAGLISFDLDTFSSTAIILSKTYDSKKMPYEYFIRVVNYEVVVYYCDKKTIFEYTGIDARHLTPAEQLALIEGYYVLDKKELYSILENYSS